jgi:hypothetical protein
MKMAAMELGNTPRPAAWSPPLASFSPPALILATSMDPSGAGFAANPLGKPAPQTRRTAELEPAKGSGVCGPAGGARRRREPEKNREKGSGVLRTRLDQEKGDRAPPRHHPRVLHGVVVLHAAAGSGALQAAFLLVFSPFATQFPNFISKNSKEHVVQAAAMVYACEIFVPSSGLDDSPTEFLIHCVCRWELSSGGVSLNVRSRLCVPSESLLVPSRHV